MLWVQPTKIALNVVQIKLLKLVFKVEQEDLNVKNCNNKFQSKKQPSPKKHSVITDLVSKKNDTLIWIYLLKLLRKKLMNLRSKFQRLNQLKLT